MINKNYLQIQLEQLSYGNCSLGVVSLTFRELPKIFSRNLCITEIELLMRVSS